MLRSPSAPVEDDVDSTSTPKPTKTSTRTLHGTNGYHSSSNRPLSPTAIASSSHELNPVDYLSLSDALQDDSSSFEQQGNPEDSTDSVLDRDSIELASSDEAAGVSSSSSSGGGDKDQVQSETLLEILGGQGDLEQRMNAIEALESGRDDHGPDNNLTAPTCIRVMYMGAASAKDKRLVFRKLSKALATFFSHDGSSSLFHNPNVFKERKHHILLMSLLPEDGDDDMVETCEDNGLSIIEADFTWSTLSPDKDNKLNAMISHYLWLQCEDPWITATAATATTAAGMDSPVRPKSSSAERFDGFIYPEKSPNGIDLCVYFYDCSIPNPAEDDRVEEDLGVLWLLKRLAVPIIPILSGGRRGSRSSSSSVPRSVADRRSQLAELLAQYKIRCIDISQSNLDIGRPPSFQRGARYRPMMDHANLEKRLGTEWANTSVATPAPYNILTVDQFSALDRRVIFNVFKQSRQKALKKERVLKAIHSHRPSSISATSTCATSTTTTTTTTATTTTTTTTNVASGALSDVLFCFFLLLLLLLLGIVLSQYRSTPHHPRLTHPSPWTATLILSVSNRSLLLDLKQDHQYNITVPLPACLPSTDSPTSLATLVLDHPPQVNFAINRQQQQSTCPPPDTPFFPPTPSVQLASSTSNLPGATLGPLEDFYRTTTFLFRRPKKFFKIMWERGRGK